MNTRRQFLQFAGGGFAAVWATSHARAAWAGGEKGRVPLYEIHAFAEGREVGMWRLAQELHFQPLGRVPTASRLVIGADEVPTGAVTFRVTPVGFFHKGEPINGTLQAM